jgi:hypothetical protein
MLRATFGVALAAGVAVAVLSPTQSHAAACANGVYRAGCVGPNGAAVVRKPPANYNNGHYYGHNNYYHGSSVHCAHGYNRGGCVRTY